MNADPIHGPDGIPKCGVSAKSPGIWGFVHPAGSVERRPRGSWQELPGRGRPGQRRGGWGSPGVRGGHLRSPGGTGTARGLGVAGGLPGVAGGPGEGLRAPERPALPASPAAGHGHGPELPAGRSTPGRSVQRSRGHGERGLPHALRLWRCAGPYRVFPVLRASRNVQALIYQAQPKPELSAHPLRSRFWLPQPCPCTNTLRPQRERFWCPGEGRMEVLKEKEEEEQIGKEELKDLEISDVEMKVPVEQAGIQRRGVSEFRVPGVFVQGEVPLPELLLAYYLCLSVSSCPGSDFDWSSIDTSQLPSSYKTNSLSEKMLLRVADGFLRRYTHLCPDRKLLFLHPVNECGVEKFVSTTVRPTLLPYSELYNWDACASFVSDHLTMEPLKCPVTLPSSLYSPTTILKFQRGNCFDFSVLLCSLLIGAGYDAYCVHGYATHEICTLDETLELCPLLRKPQEAPKEGMKKSSKYRLKPPPDLQIKFELQEAEAKKAETEAAQKNKEREEEKVTEVEKPERDPLYGLRVHAWVLVLSGSRDITETFFINPFTGNRHSTTDEHFLGIESVWNDSNYWVNMQDCSSGCKDLIFDLSDAVRWETMLPESTDADEEKELSGRATGGMQEQGEKYMDFHMPLSWVARIQISPRDFETRYPQGRKVTLYKKAKLEKWTPCLNGNGLVKRLTIYADLDYTEAVEVREWFKNREDRLDMREVNKQTQLTTDYFGPGHLFQLKAHTYTSLDPEAARTMEFYNKTRSDDLQKCVKNANEMTEYFVGRDDFLYVRHTEFGKRGNEMDVAGPRADINFRPIVKIKECFHRNPEKPCDEDVAERVFLITEETIHLEYHRKEFSKLGKREIVLIPEMCIMPKGKCVAPLTSLIQRMAASAKCHLARVTDGLQIEMKCNELLMVGSSKYDKNPFRQHELLQELMVKMKQLQKEVRESAAEVLNILKTYKNTESDKAMDTMEHKGDYLTPYLPQTGHRGRMTKEHALSIRDACLADYKHLLINRVNTIQARLEKAGAEQQKKNLWFRENRGQLSAEEESNFRSQCCGALFHIHQMELRLKREKKMAPLKYSALEEKLSKDLHLTEHLSHA
ncbi:dynein regulatory complex subunit 7 [Podargus strigoides]